jgi:phosphate transport system permease protein
MGDAFALPAPSGVVTAGAGAAGGRGAPGAGRTRRPLTDEPGRADRVFDRMTLGAGITVLVVLTLVGIFLLWQSRHAFAEVGWSFFTTSAWRTSVYPPQIGVLGLLFGTIVVALIAETIAVPMGVFVGLYIAEYSPLAVRKLLQGLIDLLAAIPSILFGIWGFFYLSDRIVPLSRWLTTHLGWIPIFKTEPDASLVGSFFIAGIVVSLMVIPIVASISRAVFAQTPPGEKEAALALGSTHWGMVRTVVFPYGRGGMIGGAMLGLGRALGETIAVSLLLPQVPWISGHILQEGGSTIAGFIALRAGSDPFTVSGLMAAGLVLFLLTLATNLIASTVVARSRSGMGVDA